MKPCLLVSAAIASVSAYPGMGKLMADLHRLHNHNHSYNGRAPAVFLGSTKLLGDVSNLPDSALTPVGADIKAILGGAGQPLASNSLPVYDAPGPLGSTACAASTCCVYKHAMLDMTSAFSDASTGGCSSLARGAIRLGFHDAGAWDLDAGYGGGGADGSILLSDTEFARPVNRGLEAIANQTLQWYAQYHQYGASMADLIQLGAMTAVAACPGGPRMRFFVGRQDRTDAALDRLLPQPTDDATTTIALFSKKSFSAGGLAALIGAHTVSQQFVVDPQHAGASQDPTPGQWDTDYYTSTTAQAPPPGVFRFASDVSLARHGDTAGSFSFFGTPSGRNAWQTAFAAEYLRLSILGVYDLNSMKDCTGVLPLSTFQG